MGVVESFGDPVGVPTPSPADADQASALITQPRGRGDERVPAAPNLAEALAAAVVILSALFCGSADAAGLPIPARTRLVRGHGGVKEVGEEQYVEIPEMNLFYRTVCGTA